MRCPAGALGEMLEERRVSLYISPPPHGILKVYLKVF